MGVFRRFGQRLVQDPDQIRAQEIRAACGAVARVEQIALMRPRSRARVAGVVEAIKVVPSRSTTTLEAQIYDGTDKVTAIWLGRRRIPGIDLGTGLVLEGTITGRLDALTMINPSYELFQLGS